MFSAIFARIINTIFILGRNFRYFFSDCCNIRNYKIKFVIFQGSKIEPFFTSYLIFNLTQLNSVFLQACLDMSENIFLYFGRLAIDMPTIPLPHPRSNIFLALQFLAVSIKISEV